MNPAWPAKLCPKRSPSTSSSSAVASGSSRSFTQCSFLPLYVASVVLFLWSSNAGHRSVAHFFSFLLQLLISASIGTLAAYIRLHGMASSPSIAATSSKAVSNSKAPASSTTQFQNGPGATGDNFGSRRSGGTGSFGAGSYSRVTPRNIQNRKPSKQSRKFRLDEDAIAETVSYIKTPW
jgi:hypothetical protein